MRQKAAASHLNAIQSRRTSLDAEYPSHASVPAALVPISLIPVLLTSCPVPKWAVLLSCPLNSASYPALVSLFILVRVSCRLLKSPSLVPLGAALQLSGVSAPGSSFTLRFL